MENTNNTRPLPELGSDSYKDVLASLSELDDTDAVNIDYLEANKTRTFHLSKEHIDMDANSSAESKKHTSGSTRKIIYAIILVIVFLFLIVGASKL